MISITNSELDQEWIELIMQAKEIGLDKDEIMEFLLQNAIQEEAIERVR